MRDDYTRKKKALKGAMESLSNQRIMDLVELEEDTTRDNNLPHSLEPIKIMLKIVFTTRKRRNYYNKSDTIPIETENIL